MKQTARYLLCSISISAFLISCQVEEPVKPNQIMTSEDIPQLILTQTDYDSVQVSLEQPIHMSDQLVASIYVDIVTARGQKILSDTLQPSYQKVANGWEINLTKTYGFSDSVTAIDVNLQIDQQYAEVITRSASLQCLKYPYPSAQIILSFRDVQGIGDYGVQDLAVRDQHVYLFGFGADGAWDYDHENHNINYLFVTGFGGDYMTVNDTALYCDFADYDIGRYSFHQKKFYFNNELSDSIQAHIDDVGIQGITKAGSLLVVLASTSNFHQSVFWITPELQLVDWQNIDSHFSTVSGIAYADSILFTVQGFKNPAIVRYSFSEKKILPTLMAPSKGVWGIDIIGDWLYFVDNAKKIVGAVPLGALKTLPQ